jgi:hypothetical protein
VELEQLPAWRDELHGCMGMMNVAMFTMQQMNEAMLAGGSIPLGDPRT